MINYNRLGYEIKRDLTDFSKKISHGVKRPQQKFIHQMLYGILAGNKLHLSEIARSLKENITLKKTIDRLSRNLNSFGEKQTVMQDYLSLVKHHIKEGHAVIVIDNSDIAKPASRKLEALSEIRDGSTGEITQGYLTIEAAVLSESGKMPLPVYEKVFSAAESGFVSETYENLCCLESLSENFSKKCVRTLDRGFDANDYYRYFLKRSERFVIRKMSCIPVRLCEFPEKELVLTVVYGFGEEPMLLLSNLKMQEKKRLCHIVAKVYLMRWRIEEYFKFKKQQFELEDLRVMSLKSIRSLNLFATLAAGYIGLTSSVHKDSIFLMELKECSKRIYEVPQFIFYALGYAIERVLSMCRKGINGLLPKKVKSQQLNLFKYFNIADPGAFVF